MFCKKVSLVIGVMFLGLILITGCSQSSGNGEGDSEGQNAQLSVGTTNKDSSLYAYYGGLTKAISQSSPNIQLTIMETGATNDNIKRMMNGQVDMGLAVLDGAYEAYEGILSWDGKAQPELRNLFTYTENALFYVVRDDSGVSKFEDLKGKKFNAGIVGSTTETQTKMIFDLLDVAPKYDSGSIGDAVDAMKDNHIIGLTKTGVGANPDSTVMDLETSTELKLLGYSEDEIKKIQDEYPWLRTTVIPEGVYEWQKEPVTTIAQQIANVATSELSTEVGYEITKAAFEGKKFQEEAYQAISSMDFIELTLKSPIPLHSGTVKYLQEIDVEVPKELIPPEWENEK